MSSTSCPTGSGAAPWVGPPRFHSPRPGTAPRPPRGTTHCHTQCSRPLGSTPPPALHRGRCPPSGARTGALWGEGQAAVRCRSLRLRPQMPRRTPPTSLQILSSPACVCVPLSPAPYLADPRCGTLGPGCPKCVPIPGHVNEKHWLEQNLGSHRDDPAALQRTPCLQSPSLSKPHGPLSPRASPTSNVTSCLNCVGPISPPGP